MRYFFCFCFCFCFYFLALAKTSLSLCICHATFAAVLIFLLGSFARIFTSVLPAPASTISLTNIALLADDHLTTTT